VRGSKVSRIEIGISVAEREPGVLKLDLIKEEVLKSSTWTFQSYGIRFYDFAGRWMRETWYAIPDSWCGTYTCSYIPSNPDCHTPHLFRIPIPAASLAKIYSQISKNIYFSSGLRVVLADKSTLRPGHARAM
jgi:hypothetical protein